MSLHDVYLSEIRSKTRLIRMSRRNRTPRPQPPHNGTGFVQDRREREKIINRMFPDREGRV